MKREKEIVKISERWKKEDQIDIVYRQQNNNKITKQEGNLELSQSKR